MPFENQIHLLEVNSIVILRNERQRSEVEDDVEQQHLMDSIRRNGLINPIVVRKDGFPDPVLVAGERRLRAFKSLKMPTIPARFLNEINPIEAAIIELEENIARKDLTWQDTARAIVKLHNLHVEVDPEWTQVKTAIACSISGGIISRYMKVGEYFDDPRIMESASLTKAESVIGVMEGRRRGAAWNSLFESPLNPQKEGEGEEETGPEDGLPAALLTSEPTGAPAPGTTTGAEAKATAAALFPITIIGDVKPEPSAKPALPPKVVRNIADAILHENFLEWAPKYKGRKFNFIHVDFPYGAVEVGPQMKGNEAEIYADSPEIYINLLNCFCENLDRFFARAGWIMFWYSERMGQITRDTFKIKAPSLTVQTHPLIWIHTDNAGISPDHTKYPRHIYDTAMLIGRGNFPLVKMKSDAYGCPTDRRVHPSTKPEPMLKFFFEMFMDEHTQMFDPTCGGGSSLRAAESLGCQRTLGIEANWEYVEPARKELQERRNIINMMRNVFAKKEGAT